MKNKQPCKFKKKKKEKKYHQYRPLLHYWIPKNVHNLNKALKQKKKERKTKKNPQYLPVREQLYR